MLKIKKTFLIICMLLCAAVLYSQGAQNKDVLYYNNNADEEGWLHPLTMKNGVWTADDGQFIEDVVVDQKNGFISYIHEGNVPLQVALYKSKNDTFIGVSSITSCGGYVKFWKVSGKKWIDATSDILPALDVKEFFADCYKNADWNAVEKAAKESFAAIDFNEGLKVENLESCASFIYELPRYGTDIKVTAFFVNKIYGGFEHYLTEKAQKSLKNLYKKSKTITLSWDMDKGKFYRKK